METHEHRRRAVILAVVLLAVAALIASDDVNEFVRRVLDQTRTLIAHHPRLGMMVFVLFSILSAILLFFSSAILVPVATYVWGQPMTLLLLWAGWMIGAVASYWIGRFPARKFFRWIMPARKAARYEKKISASATFPLVLMFQLALPSEIPGYVLGAARYSFPKFLLARALAELPFAIGAVYLGESFVERNYVLFLSIGAAGLIFSIAMFRLFHHRLEKA